MPPRRPSSVAEGPAPRPFLKWAGGKAQLLPALLQRVPEGIETYYEPFVGGGALFFALMADPARRPRRAVLSDLNGDLVTTYEAVRDEPQALLERLESMQEEYLDWDHAGRTGFYYQVRASEPSKAVERAARLIFLNKTCFNGLYRVNRRGEFNVPHGRYRAPHIADAETVFAASAALRETEIRSVDFEAACAGAGPQDFLYFDPPFQPLSATANFTSYTQQDFGRADQVRLKRTIDRLTARGVPVLLSNSPHPWVRGGYEFAGYTVEQVRARRAINSRGDRRGPIPELMVTNLDVLRGTPAWAGTATIEA